MKASITIAVFVAVALAGCSSCESADAPAPAPHVHAQTEPSDTCEALCYPGTCAHSYDIGKKSVGACKDKGPSLCVCTYPRD